MKIILFLLINISLAAAAAPTPIEVDIKYLYYRNGWDDYKTLKNGSVLYRGKDFFKIIFTPSQDAYVYIFAKGSSGNIYRIFTMRAFKGKTINNFNPVSAGMDYYIPKKDKAFSLGGLAGKESIYFIVSKHQDVELERKYNEILYAHSIKSPTSKIVASRAFEHTILTRDFSDIVYDPIATTAPSTYEISKSGKRFIVIRDRLLSCDGCVSQITYELR